MALVATFELVATTTAAALELFSTAEAAATLATALELEPELEPELVPSHTAGPGIV